MPAYIVELPDVGGLQLDDGDTKFIVFAADATDARMIVKDHFRSAALDAIIADSSTTVTALVGGTNYQGWNLQIQLTDPDDKDSTVVDITATGTLGIASAAVTAGGTGHSVNDILTLGGGTKTRAARFRVTAVSSGVVTTVELVDAGDYTAVPSGAQATTSGGSGVSCTLTPTGGTYTLANILAHAVTLLNATLPIATATVDSGNDTGQLLTIAASGDNLGDHIVNYVFSDGGRINHAAAVAAVVDEGIVAAALTLRFATSAETTIPRLIGAYK